MNQSIGYTILQQEYFENWTIDFTVCSHLVDLKSISHVTQGFVSIVEHNHSDLLHLITTKTQVSGHKIITWLPTLWNSTAVKNHKAKLGTNKPYVLQTPQDVLPFAEFLGKHFK